MKIISTFLALIVSASCVVAGSFSFQIENNSDGPWHYLQPLAREHAIVNNPALSKKQVNQAAEALIDDSARTEKAITAPCQKGDRFEGEIVGNHIILKKVGNKKINIKPLLTEEEIVLVAQVTKTRNCPEKAIKSELKAKYGVTFKQGDQIMLRSNQDWLNKPVSTGDWIVSTLKGGVEGHLTSLIVTKTKEQAERLVSRDLVSDKVSGQEEETVSISYPSNPEDLLFKTSLGDSITLPSPPKYEIAPLAEDLKKKEVKSEVFKETVSAPPKKDDLGDLIWKHYEKGNARIHSVEEKIQQILSSIFRGIADVVPWRSIGTVILWVIGGGVILYTLIALWTFWKKKPPKGGGKSNSAAANYVT